METIAHALVAPGRGILAADESLPTIGKRFDQIRIRSSAATRRAYRDLLMTAPGIEEAISGVILFDETLRQKTSAGLSFARGLKQRGIIPGIKVDQGTADLPGFPGEKFTLGLDALRGRLAEYYKLGARFTKWRAVISIGEGRPSGACLEANARSLALFASLSQEAQLVPIVEPEVLMDGAHSIEECEYVTTETLRTVFAALALQDVRLEAILLKCGMVVSGSDHDEQADAEQVAAATLRSLRRCVPASVPGVVFLSGGQSPEAATEHLAAITRAAAGKAPWALSFSFGRALQDPALKAWKGKKTEVAAAQAALLRRARANAGALAMSGERQEDGRSPPEAG